MPLQKLTSTSAFIAFDLPGAPAAGVVRLARKVLQDGAWLLARSTTYSFASFGLQMGGGSAGIDAEGDARDGAVAAFVDEVAAQVADGSWSPEPGLGLTDADFAPLSLRPEWAALRSDGLGAELTANGAVAAAAAVRQGGLDGARCAVAGAGPVVDAARARIEASGGTVAGDRFDTDADVLFLAGKTGILGHELAESVTAGIVVPLSPVPVTARAHAVLTQAGKIHVPDFLSIAAPLLHAFDGDGGDPVERVGHAVQALAPNGTGLWMAAVVHAEEFLQTWQDTLPFGRPLA